MTKIIRLNIKKSVQRFFGKNPLYSHCRLVVREMSKRGLVVADSYVQVRYGLDLVAILIACKNLLRPTDSQNIAPVSLKFLSAHATKIFTECATREEVLCKLYELKHTISDAMQYQLKFSGIINEKIANTRSLERILDSIIFTLNCLDIHFVNSNSLARDQALKLLGYDAIKKSEKLNTKQLNDLMSLLLLRASLIAEQALLGKQGGHLQGAILKLDNTIKNTPNHPPIELIKLTLEKKAA